MPKKGHVPERTCVVCRTKKSKWELFRFFVDSEKKIRLDLSCKGPGRGAYVCPACLLKLKKKRNQEKLKKALRAENISFNFEEILKSF